MCIEKVNKFPKIRMVYGQAPTGHIYLPASAGTPVPYQSSSVSTTLSDLRTLAFKYLLKANGTNFVSKEKKRKNVF